MSSVYDALKTYFKAEEWRYEELEEQEGLRLHVQTGNGKWSCYAQPLEERTAFLFYSVYPLNASEDQRTDVAELLSRINFGLASGNFELDMDDGQIRYKTGIDVTDDRLSDALIRNVVYANIETMDRYMPALAALLEDKQTPRAAVELVEGQGER